MTVRRESFDASGSEPFDEESLLAGLRAGDEQAYERMVRSFSPKLLAVARRFLSNDADAQDALQDAFLSAFRSLGRFDGASRLYTWLHRITVNAALMKIRTSKRRNERAIEDLLPRYQEDGHRLDVEPAWDAGADDLAQSHEARDLVRKAIDSLPDDFRNILLLRDIEELDTRQTSELLGVSEPAVKTRLHRARQALRAIMQPYFLGETDSDA